MLGVLLTTDSRNIVLERLTGWCKEHFQNVRFDDAVEMADLCIKLSDGKSEYTLLRTKASVFLALENASKALLAGQFETCIEILKPYDDSQLHVKDFVLTSATAALVVKKLGNKQSNVDYDWLVCTASAEITRKSHGANGRVGLVRIIQQSWKLFVIVYLLSMILVMAARFVWMRL
jgi:hypothetical protein